MMTEPARSGVENVQPTPVAPRLRSAVELSGLVIPPVTLISALAYYFGWRFTNARALYFGFDPSILGFSTQDYILRAVDPLFLPLSAILLLLLIVTFLHSTCAGWLSRNSGDARRPLVSGPLALLGFGLAVAGAGNLAGSGRPHFGAPLLLATGTVMICYAADVYGGRGGGKSTTATRVHTVRWVLLCCIMAAALFWSVGDWADAVGRGRARSLAEQLSFRPAAILFSKQPLHLGSEQVIVTEIADAGDAFRFRYTGLRVLLWSAGKYFLLSEGWAPGEGHAIVLKDDDTIRVEFKTS